ARIACANRPSEHSPRKRVDRSFQPSLNLLKHRPHLRSVPEKKLRLARRARALSRAQRLENWGHRRLFGEQVGRLGFARGPCLERADSGFDGPTVPWHTRRRKQFSDAEVGQKSLRGRGPRVSRPRTKSEVVGQFEGASLALRVGMGTLTRSASEGSSN